MMEISEMCDTDTYPRILLRIKKRFAEQQE